MKNQDKMKALKARLQNDFNDLTGQILTGRIAWLFLRAGLDAAGIALLITGLIATLYSFGLCDNAADCSFSALILIGIILGYGVYTGSRISTRRSSLPLRYHGPLLAVYLLFFTAVGIYMVTDSIILCLVGGLIVAVSGYRGYRKGISDRSNGILKV